MWVAVRTINSSQASLKPVLPPLKPLPLDFKWGEGHLSMKLVSGRARLALRFAGSDAALGLVSEQLQRLWVAPPQVSIPCRSCGSAWHRSDMRKHLDEQTIIVV